MRNIEGCKPLLPFGASAGAGDLGNDAVDLVAAVPSRGRGRKARVLREVWPFQRIAQLAPKLSDNKEGLSLSGPERPKPLIAQ
jgi:hypothetical protein